MSSTNSDGLLTNSQNEILPETKIFSDFEANRQSLHFQIADYIQELIAAKKLVPESKLPSERDLAIQFGVNRATIREAIKLLMQRGLIEIRRGLGVFLTEVAPSVVAESIRRYSDFGSNNYEALMEVRFILEPEIAALAAQRATEKDLKELQELSELLTEQINKKNYAERAKIDAQFHLALARASHNEFIIAIMSGLEETMTKWIVQAAHFYRLPEGRKSHQSIYEAIRARNPDLSREAMHTHTYYARQTIEQDKPR